MKAVVRLWLGETWVCSPPCTGHDLLFCVLMAPVRPPQDPGPPGAGMPQILDLVGVGASTRAPYWLVSEHLPCPAW